MARTIKTALLASTLALLIPCAASAGIDQSLEQVCVDTVKFSAPSTSYGVGKEQRYQEKLNQVFSASSCNGKALINNMQFALSINEDESDQTNSIVVRSEN